METKDLKEYIRRELADLTDKMETDVGIQIGEYVGHLTSACEEMLKWKLSLDEQIQMSLLRVIFNSIGHVITDDNVDDLITNLTDIMQSSRYNLFKLMIQYGLGLVDMYSQSMGFHFDHNISKLDDNFINELCQAIRDYTPNNQLSEYEEVKSQISKWIGLVEPSTVESLVATDKVSLFKKGYVLMKNNPNVPICLKPSKDNDLGPSNEPNSMEDHGWHLDDIEGRQTLMLHDSLAKRVPLIKFNLKLGGEFTSKVNRTCELMHELLTGISIAEDSPSNKHEYYRKIIILIDNKTALCHKTPVLFQIWRRQCKDLQAYYHGNVNAYERFYATEQEDAMSAIWPMELNEFIDTVRQILLELAKNGIPKAKELVNRCDTLWFPCTPKDITTKCIGVLTKATTFDSNDCEVSPCRQIRSESEFELPAKRNEDISINTIIGDIHRRAIQAIAESNVTNAMSILDEIQDVLSKLFETDGPYNSILSVLGADQHLLQLLVKNSEK